MAPLRETNERAWPAESRTKVGAAPLRSGPQTARRPRPAGWGAVAVGAAAPSGAPRFLEAGCVRFNRGVGGKRGGRYISHHVWASPLVRRLRSRPRPRRGKVPRRAGTRPLPRPRADSRPSRPSGQAPSRPAPAPSGSPSGLGFGVRGADWGWRPRLLGPCPHLWPPEPAL